MKTILVPTDFSKHAKYATEVAMNIAKRANAKLLLLHIVELPSSDSINVEGETSYSDSWEDKLFKLKLIEKGKRELAMAACEAEDAGVATTQELRLGNPFHGIRTIITDHKVDLVVMGTEGHSKLEEMLIGSNTEKVVRYAKCPVLTVHEKPKGDVFKNIVYATSMDEDENGFVQIILNAQDIYNATIHIVRVNTPDNFHSDKVVKKLMGDFAKKVQLKNYTMNSFNDYSEEQGIINFADSINADMIAMSTHGRKGIAHVLAGSIAEDVANHAKRPVLTYVSSKK
jgi:nucleotide-binding universal stress UspA family protein